MKQKLTELKGEADSSTITFGGDFNTPIIFNWTIIDVQYYMSYKCTI